MSAHSGSPDFAGLATVVPFTDRVGVYADALVRLTAGLLLMPHGAQKLFGWFGGPGLEGAGQMFATKLGLPPWLAIVAGVVEFFGGALLALGIATRVVGLVVAGMMFFVVFAVHLPQGFFWSHGGYEYPLLWGVVALSYALRGGGHCSIDALLWTRR
ncbi:MAG TPA: DoxX family protein [Methylocystis sp.]|nr:DoxX family protein [Methylocystis sp.]